MGDRSLSYHDALGRPRAWDGRPQAHHSLPICSEAGAAEAAWQPSQSSGASRSNDVLDAEQQKELEKQLVFMLMQSNARQAQQDTNAGANTGALERRRAVPKRPSLAGAITDLHRQPHDAHQQPQGIHRESDQHATSKHNGVSHRGQQQKQQKQQHDHSSAHVFPYMSTSSAQHPVLHSAEPHGMFSLDSLPPQVRTKKGKRTDVLCRVHSFLWKHVEIETTCELARTESSKKVAPSI